MFKYILAMPGYHLTTIPMPGPESFELATPGPPDLWRGSVAFERGELMAVRRGEGRAMKRP